MGDTRRDTIFAAVSDAAGRFIYYDRKEDATLPVGAIEAAIAEGELTLDDIVAEFRASLGLEK